MISLLAIIATLVLVASALLWRAVLELPRASARLSALFRDALRNDAITFDPARRRRTAPNGARHRRVP